MPEVISLLHQAPQIIAVELSKPLGSMEFARSILNVSENRRLDLFRFSSDRYAFLAAHVLKRLAIAAAIGCKPQKIIFNRNHYGKPYLKYYPNFHFSLSHTYKMAALALSTSGPVGIDVEHLDQIEFDMNMAELVCNDLEMMKLWSSESASHTFAGLWTAKEAVVKAEGKGMFMSMKNVLPTTGKDFTPKACWSLSQYTLTSGHVMALAWGRKKRYSNSSMSPGCALIQEEGLLSWANQLYPPGKGSFQRIQATDSNPF